MLIYPRKQRPLVSILFVIVSFTVIICRGQCPGLTSCATCSSPTQCTACTDPGVNGVRADGSGCDECALVSAGTCTVCTTLKKCDGCESAYTGPVNGTTSAMCANCAINCQFCDVVGAGACDALSCKAGYAADNNGVCQSCYTGCPSCTHAGPGGCDTCPPGQGLTNSDPQAPVCANCTDTSCAFCYATPSTCEECKAGFSFVSGKCTGGSISTSTVAGSTIAVTSPAAASPSTPASVTTSGGVLSSITTVPSGVSSATGGSTTPSSSGVNLATAVVPAVVGCLLLVLAVLLLYCCCSRTVVAPATVVRPRPWVPSVYSGPMRPPAVGGYYGYSPNVYSYNTTVIPPTRGAISYAQSPGGYYTQQPRYVTESVYY